jgi:DNA mismatch repair protein MSH5
MIGIIVYLAHLGSYVPAEQAEIGIIEHIFSRIDSGDSRAFNSFSRQLTQLSLALNNSQHKSLLIFDEFGKGNSADDGCSLFTALIEEVQLNPKASGLFSTHFHEIFTKGLVSENECVKFYSMEVSHLQEMVFLYKLLKGASLNSFGIFCAGLAGISGDVLERSEKVQKFLKNCEDLEKEKKKIREKLDFVCCWQEGKEESFDYLVSLIETLN